MTELTRSNDATPHAATAASHVDFDPVGLLKSGYDAAKTVAHAVQEYGSILMTPLNFVPGAAGVGAAARAAAHAAEALSGEKSGEGKGKGDTAPTGSTEPSRTTQGTVEIGGKSASFVRTNPDAPKLPEPSKEEILEMLRNSKPMNLER